MIDYQLPHPLHMQPIANPFAGDWDIDQVFQMEMRCGQQPELAHQFAYGYYDNVQNNFIIELQGNGEKKYYTANGTATLRSLLDLVYGVNAAYEFTQKAVLVGEPLPQDDNDVLALFLEDLAISSMDVTIWGGNFDEEALAQAPQEQEQQHWAQGHAPPPPIVIPQPPPQEEFDEPAEEQVQQPPAIEQPLLLPPIGQLGLYDEDPLSDEEEGPIS